MTETTPEAADFRTVPPKITAAAVGWQAWWEDHDLWDGFLLYADLDTAKKHAAVDYVGEEYGWVPGDDPADETPEITLTWAFEHERWHLLDNGKSTPVQLYRTSTYVAAAGPAPVTDRAARRERYAAAISDTDGWVLDGGQHMIDAVMAVADVEQAELRRERDLAVAHDRQPYPTAWAYEQACKTLHRKEAAIERVLTFAASLDETGREIAGPDAVHPVAAHLRHLLDTTAEETPQPAASPAIRRKLRRWAYAAGHIESELEGAVDRMYALIARDIACGPEPAAPAVVAQPDEEASTPDPDVVAYRSHGGRLLRCITHAPEWAAILCGDFHPVTSEDLPDGGICTYPDCGVDVLIPQEPSS